MNSLDVFLQVAVVVECHATLITHDVFGLQMNFVNMLTKVGVFSFAVGTLGLTHIYLLHTSFEESSRAKKFYITFDTDFWRYLPSRSRIGGSLK